MFSIISTSTKIAVTGSNHAATTKTCTSHAFTAKAVGIYPSKQMECDVGENHGNTRNPKGAIENPEMVEQFFYNARVQKTTGEDWRAHGAPRFETNEARLNARYRRRHGQIALGLVLFQRF